MIHVYHGDGKGKTTAAFGLALRALGAGERVLVCQLLKDGTSGEARMMASLPGAQLLHDTPPVKFSFRMDEAERAASRAEHDEHLRLVVARLREASAGLVVVDEALGALAAGLVDEALVREALSVAAGAADGPELVLTGRNPPEFVLEAADYVTEMRCVRHPFQRGVVAREGVEY